MEMSAGGDGEVLVGERFDGSTPPSPPTLVYGPYPLFGKKRT